MQTNSLYWLTAAIEAACKPDENGNRSPWQQLSRDPLIHDLLASLPPRRAETLKEDFDAFCAAESASERKKHAARIRTVLEALLDDESQPMDVVQAAHALTLVLETAA